MVEPVLGVNANTIAVQWVLCLGSENSIPQGHKAAGLISYTDIQIIRISTEENVQTALDSNIQCPNVNTRKANPFGEFKGRPAGCQLNSLHVSKIEQGLSREIWKMLCKDLSENSNKETSTESNSFLNLSSNNIQGNFKGNKMLDGY